MSEYLRDSGHFWMRTCDDCGGAFYCGDAADSGDGAPDWTCATCVEKDAEIARLRAALKPFAALAAVYARLADTGRWEYGRVVVGAADNSAEAPITVDDCRAAVKAMEET